MKNKAETLNQTQLDSGSYENLNMPDYPDYPDCDDIYNTHLDRKEIDSKFIFRTKASQQISKKHETLMSK
jgi:hypothetical protein